MNLSVSKTRLLVVVLSFLTDDRQSSVEARHEIRHLMAQAPGDRHSQAADYFEAQWHALNRSRLWHAGTAIILGAVSIWGLKTMAGRSWLQKAATPAHPGSYSTPSPRNAR